MTNVGTKEIGIPFIPSLMAQKSSSIDDTYLYAGLIMQEAYLLNVNQVTNKNPNLLLMSQKKFKIVLLQ